MEDWNAISKKDFLNVPVRPSKLQCGTFHDFLFCLLHSMTHYVRHLLTSRILELSQSPHFTDMKVTAQKVKCFKTEDQFVIKLVLEPTVPNSPSVPFSPHHASLYAPTIRLSLNQQYTKKVLQDRFHRSPRCKIQTMCQVGGEIIFLWGQQKDFI